MSKLSEQYTQQIYSNGSGTTVEVSIKTKKPSKQTTERYKSPSKPHIENTRDMNWDTLLSQDDRSDIFSQSKHKKPLSLKSKSKESVALKNPERIKRLKSVRQLNAQEHIDSKRFASKTKSSISKEKELSENVRHIPSATQYVKSSVTSKDKGISTIDPTGSVQSTESCVKESIPKDFPKRTLQIFLRELRVAVNSNSSNTNSSTNSVDLNKIIDDIEYVAANLNPNMAKNAVIASSSQQNKKPDGALGFVTKHLPQSQSPKDFIQAQIVRQLQLEVEKVINFICNSTLSVLSNQNLKNFQSNVINICNFSKWSKRINLNQ